MLALLLTISLFIFVTVVGYATLILLYTQHSPLLNLLLAPVIGIAIITLSIFLLSNLGLPVEKFALWLTGILLLSSIITFWRFNPKIVWRDYLFFIIVFLAALCVVGQGLLHFGFSWLSYVNDDMVNYCLGSTRFLHHGYSTPPDLQALLLGKNYSAYFWFMFVSDMMRSGSELLLAWVSAIIHLMPDQIFMPVILVLYLSLISVTCALVYQTHHSRSLALITGGLVSVSALTTLGVLNQLIAQVGGLGILIASIILLFKHDIPHYPHTTLRFSLLISIVISSLAIFYPEVTPFLGLSFFIYCAILYFQKQWPYRSYWITLALATLLSSIFLNSYLINFLKTIFSQTHQGFISANPELALFPYFLIPSGLASLWGFLPISFRATNFFSEFASWLFIATGAVLLLITFLLSIYLSWKYKHASAVVAFVMLSTAIYLFINNNDFGLFKLAMYIQPFLWSLWVSIGFYWFRWRLTIVSLFLLFVLTNINLQYFHVKKSIKGFEITTVSLFDINRQFKYLLRELPSSARLLSGTEHIALAKLEALYASGISTFFISRPFFSYLVKGNKSFLTLFTPHLAKQFEEFKTILGNLKKFKFSLKDKQHPEKNNIFFQQDIKTTKATYIIESPAALSIINRRIARKDSDKKPFSFTHLPAINNYLIFVNSALGQHYYLPDDYSHIALYRLEADYFYPKATLAGIGRHLLFQVINPTSPFRLVFNLTESMNADHKNQLPPVSVIGQERKPFFIAGRGSARLFSSPLIPQWINGYPYIAIDMGKEGQIFHIPRYGLMRLYGKKILIDNRKLTGFARDISLISEDQYMHLHAPTTLSDFPSDLLNPDLEYSGAYEDGWLSESVYFYLTQTEGNYHLSIKGMWPQQLGTQDITIHIDGKQLVNKALNEKEFALSIPILSVKRPTRRKIELHFSHYYSLSSEDTRPASIKLNFIGFVK